MRILAIGDPHFGTKTVNETSLMHKKILKILSKTAFNFIVVLGDVFNDHSTINILTMKRVVDFLMDLATVCPVKVLVGNHDILNNNVFIPESHSLYPLKFLDSSYKITIVDKPIIENINNFIFTFSPYVPNDRFIEALDQYTPDWKNSNIIFAHQELSGSFHNTECEEKWLDSYPFLVSGHIHKRQLVAKNFLYVGTPYDITFGEVEEKRISKIVYENNNWVDYEIDLKIPRKIQLNVDIKNYKKVIDSFIKLNDKNKQTKIKLSIVGRKSDVNIIVNCKRYYYLNKNYTLIVSKNITTREKDLRTQLSINGTFKEMLINELIRNEQTDILEVFNQIS